MGATKKSYSASPLLITTQLILLKRERLKYDRCRDKHFEPSNKSIAVYLCYPVEEYNEVNESIENKNAWITQ